MTTNRIDKLKQKKDKINQQLKELEAKQAVQERKNDTRRKVIAGALALEHAQMHPESDFAKTLYWLLDEYTKPYDRKLFGLGRKLKSEFTG